MDFNTFYRADRHENPPNVHESNRILDDVLANVSVDELKMHPKVQEAFIEIETEKLLAKMHDNFDPDSSLFNQSEWQSRRRRSISDDSGISDPKRSRTYNSSNASNRLVNDFEPMPSTSHIGFEYPSSEPSSDTSSFTMPHAATFKRTSRREQCRKLKTGKLQTQTTIIVPKNIDATLYLSNPQSKLCVICHKSYKRTVYHYKMAHPDYETFVARLSVRMANEAVHNVAPVGRVLVQLTRYKYRAQCYFCEDFKQFPLSYWLNHIRSHTGEYANECVKCDKVVCFNSHCGRPTVTDESQLINLRTTDFIGYICLECNFVQTQIENIHKHLMNEHGYPFESVQQRYRHFILLRTQDGPTLFDQQTNQFANGNQASSNRIEGRESNGTYSLGKKLLKQPIIYQCTI